MLPQTSKCSIKLYIGSITMSISLALSTCVLFILLMQLVNRAQVLNTTFLFFHYLLFALASAAVVLLTAILPLTRIYASL